MPERHMLTGPADWRLFWLLSKACALQAGLQCFWLVMIVDSAVTPAVRDCLSSVCA